MIIGHKMNDKKNIDRLFQEQLKDFEVHPPEFVWENIREKLEEKKKRRAVPIWFTYSGVAAGLVAAAFFGWQYLSGEDSLNNNTNNGVVVQPVGSEAGKPVDPKKVFAPKGEESLPGRKNSLSNNRSTLVSADDNQPDASTVNSGVQGTLQPAAKGAGNASRYNTLVTNDKDNTGKKVAGKIKTGAVTLPQSGKAVAYDAETKPASGTKSGRKATEAKATAVAGTTGTKPSKSKLYEGTNPELDINGSRKAKTGAKASYNDALANNSNGSNDARSNGMATNESNELYGKTGGTTDESGRVIPPIPVINRDIVIGSLLPGEQKLLAQMDTIKPGTENELEKLLREKEAADKQTRLADNAVGKWNVKPQVAPVFYNSFSSGSPIDAQFASNTKNFDNDVSYGLGLNYAVNNRFSIRSGVNTVNLNYATQDIQFYASFDGTTSNVSAKNAKTRNATIVVTTRGEGVADSFSANAMSDGYNGAMVQTTGYIEVPLEISYALLQKRFGLQVIGGVSTLFLNQNKVSVVSTQGLATEVGEAQNLNDVHFSTNVGLGFKYRIFKALEANFEPTLKYQVNTYSRDAGNFKPYFIGLYSGISFSF